MADSYSKWVMTNSFANNLQASINSGNKIEWVSIKTSDDTHLFADLAGFNDTTLATASIKQTATINTISINGNTVTITALFNNQNNQADYYIKTLFLVAKYNGTEFLAGATVANSASTAFRMPAASATEITEFTARPQITVSNSSTISATVDPVAAATNKRVDGLEATLQGEIDDINADKQSLWNTLVNYVTKAGTDTITGVKTFTQTIVGSITGNAGTATKIQTPRKLKVNLASTADQTFDGSADQVGIGVSGLLPVNSGGTGRSDGLAKPLTTTLPLSGDLNTLIATGSYYQNYSASATKWTNRPSNSPNLAFCVDVTGSEDQTLATQVYYVYQNSRMWVRSLWRAGQDIRASQWAEVANDNTVIHNTGAETVAGSKTFSSPIIGSVTGNSDTATKLATARTIAVTGDVTGSGTFDGSGNLSITTTESTTTRTNTTSTQAGGYGSTVTIIDGVTTNSAGEVTGVNTKTLTLPPTQTTVTGNAGSATKLATARTIGGVSFDGTANINLPGVNTAGNQSTTGNAGSATKLKTPRTIAITGDMTGSGTFDGSGNLSITTTESTTTRTNTTSTQAGGYGSTVTIIDGVTTNSAGEVTGVNTKTLTLPSAQTTVTGNAGTATKLQTARTINGVSFDGTANISVNAANDASLVHKTGNETVAGVKTFSDWPVVTGLNVSNGTYNAGIVHTNMSIPNQSNSNVSLGINAGSTLAIGGGEAANSFLSAMADGAVPIGSTDGISEQLVLASDVAVYVGAGYQSGGTTGKWWAFNQNGTVTSPNGNLMQEVTSTTINLYGKGTYFVNDTAPDGDYLRLIVSGKVVSVQGTLMTKVAMSGGAYLGEAIVPAQYAPPVARKNTVGFNAGSPGSKVYADVAWSIDGMLSIDNIVNGSNMTAWGTIPARSQLSFADTWVIA